MAGESGRGWLEAPSSGEAVNRRASRGRGVAGRSVAGRRRRTEGEDRLPGEGGRAHERGREVDGPGRGDDGGRAKAPVGAEPSTQPEGSEQNHKGAGARAASVDGKREKTVRRRPTPAELGVVAGRGSASGGPVSVGRRGQANVGGADTRSVPSSGVGSRARRTGTRRAGVTTTHSLNRSDGNRTSNGGAYNGTIQRGRTGVRIQGDNLRVRYRFTVVQGEGERELEVRQAAAIMGVLRWHLRQRHKGSAEGRRT
jgi:hypothetical protein